LNQGEHSLAHARLQLGKKRAEESEGGDVWIVTRVVLRRSGKLDIGVSNRRVGAEAKTEGKT
jgi:hypothetical protein